VGEFIKEIELLITFVVGVCSTIVYNIFKNKSVITVLQNEHSYLRNESQELRKKIDELVELHKDEVSKVVEESKRVIEEVERTCRVNLQRLDTIEGQVLRNKAQIQEHDNKIDDLYQMKRSLENTEEMVQKLVQALF
jgi:chromosome segregation ATPase